MPISFVTLNGVGLGHVIRAQIVSKWLCDLGQKPVIFVQGNYPQGIRCSIPGGSLPQLYALENRERSRVAGVLARYTCLSEPAILIEDTHPAPVDWVGQAIRMILMRPTVMVHMRIIRYSQRTAHVPVLLCDHPQSPTWPFNGEETAEILGWPHWQCIGPVFRRPDDLAMRQVGGRLRIDPRQELYIAFMGGGGQHVGSDDLARFHDACTAAGEQLRSAEPGARLLFLAGPLYPSQAPPPAGFEIVRGEEEVPSLLALADGAIVRPGYNSVWECIAAGCPFLPIIGLTHQEPVAERLDAVAEAGLPLCENAGDLLDGKIQAAFRAVSQSVVANFPDTPPRALRELVAKKRTPSQTLPPWPHGGSQAGSQVSLRQLHLRLDDVASLTPGVSWLLDGIRERRLKVSLEVIPYLADFGGAALDVRDPDGLLEVSQHGFAHIPHGLGGSRWGEFYHETSGASEVSKLEMRRGLDKMRGSFGSRFRGGYSAPYDCWPSWLAASWSEIGGRYLSWVNTEPSDSALPSTRAGIDPWDWRLSRACGTRQISVTFNQQLVETGRVGLVLHAALLDDADYRSSVTSLIDQALDRGVRAAHLSDVARA